MRGTANPPAASQVAFTVNTQKKAGIVAIDSSNIAAVPNRSGREILPRRPNRLQ
jgi:hypothetical protein